jgi:WD40 repeat protein
MSPEQAEMSSQDIDTRSDLYSLGVLLYELLVGKTPFDSKELLDAGLDQMRRTIREKEPLRPSTRLMGMLGEELTAIARHRQTDARRLLHLVRGDLDWIVMKCLEKDRTRRYETANGVATDIQRHLNDEPMLARPPSTLYQVQKFVRRNKLMVTSAAVIVTALVLGIAGSTAEAVRAKRAEREQERSRLQAEAARANEAQQREMAQTQELIARRRAYGSDLIAAWQSFLEGDIARTRDLLERQRPLPGQKDDFRGFEWRYLWGLSRPDELFILTNRVGAITPSVRYSPDGRFLAVANSDGFVSLWDAEGRNRLKSFQASTADVWSMAFSPDGKTLATASRESKGERVNLWNLEAAEPQAIPLPGHRQPAFWVGFTPDGKRLGSLGATAYSKGIAPEIRVWDAASHRKEFDLQGLKSWALRASFSPDGQHLACGDADGSVKVWDCNTGQEIRSFPGHQGFVSAVTFSPMGNLLATADEHGTIILWDWQPGKVSAILPAHRAPIYELAFSRDGQWLATACRDHTVKMIDIQTRDELATFYGHADRVWSVDFSPDRRFLATAGSDVRVWRAAPKADSYAFSNEKSDGTVSFSPDGQFLVQELWKSNEVILWDPAAKSKVQRSLKGRDPTFSNDGKLLVLIQDGQPVVYHVATFLSPATIAVTSPVSGPIAISPNGKLLAARREAREVIMDMETMREVTTVDGNSKPSSAPVLFTADSKQLIAVGQPDSCLQVWDTATWKPRAVLKGHVGNIEALALSPDGRILASGGSDRTVRLWNTLTWSPAPVSVLPSNAGVVMRLAFSPDGRTLASSSTDGIWRLWVAPASVE